MKSAIEKCTRQNGNYQKLTYGDIRILEIVKVLYLILPENYQNSILLPLATQKWNINVIQPLIIMITDIFKKIEPDIKERIFSEMQISFLSFTNTDEFNKLYTLLFNCYLETKDFRYIDCLRLLWNNPNDSINTTFLTDLLVKNIVYIAYSLLLY